MKVDRWPLGINKQNDAHAALNGLSHWSCVSPDSNEWWVRIDGHKVVWARHPDGLFGLLSEVDKSNPIAWYRVVANWLTPASVSCLDVEEMISECIPGGSICDPQDVADSIRAWFRRAGKSQLSWVASQDNNDCTHVVGEAKDKAAPWYTITIGVRQQRIVWLVDIHGIVAADYIPTAFATLASAKEFCEEQHAKWRDRNVDQ